MMMEEEMDISEISISNENMSIDEEKDGEAKEIMIQDVGQDESQVEVEGTTINDLPPEVLMMILKKLNIGSLLTCRLINWTWNGFASEILRNDNKAVISFMYDEESGTYRHCGCPHCKLRGDLEDFIECFKKSTRNFPFVRFLIYVVGSDLDGEDWNDFIDTIGKTIKGLKLHFGYWESIQEEFYISNMTDKMRKVKHLLLNELPVLEEFGLGFNEYFALDWLKGSKLFTLSSDSQDYPTESKSEIDTATATTTTTEDEKLNTRQLVKPIRLPTLKVLYFDQPSYFHHTGVIEDLLKAAVNLEKIECFNYHRSNFFEIEDLLFLNSIGKLHLIKTARIYPSFDFFSTLKKTFTNLVDFRLTELTLDLTGVAENPSVWVDTGKFISILFNSIKDTVKTIYFTQMGFLDGVKFPTFSKLNCYTFQKQDVLDDMSMFPPGVKSLNIFPALREMKVGKIDWMTLFPEHQNRIPCFQNMEILKVNDDELTSACIEIMGLLFPNLKSFSLDNHTGVSDFPDIGSAIWTHMNKLETLELKIDLKSIENLWPNIDSCFTGLPENTCKRLKNKLAFMKLFQGLKNDEWREDQMKDLQVSEVEKLREHVSILQLKELKKLSLHLYRHRWRGSEYSSDNSDVESSSDNSDSEDEHFDPYEAFDLKRNGRKEKFEARREELFKYAVTDVTKIYAFQLLPNLTVDVDFVHNQNMDDSD